MDAYDYAYNARTFRSFDWATFDEQGSLETLVRIHRLLRADAASDVIRLECLEAINELIERNAKAHAAQCLENGVL